MQSSNSKVPVPKQRLTSASSSTQDKAELAKAYIERKYRQLKKEEEDRKESWDDLARLMQEMRLSRHEQLLIKQEILRKEALNLRSRRKPLTAFDFQSVAVIGRGAFGEVRLVRVLETGEVLAMKKMNKTEMMHKNHVRHVRAERDVLACADNPWIVDLYCSFQDESCLYLGMEFLPGGDLMGLLIRREVLPEAEALFYTAEIVLAVESVHKLQYIHRDLKPDNVLLDRSGHVKLSDFGLCRHAGVEGAHPYEGVGLVPESGEESGAEYQRSRKLAFSTVGTPDYIAPEVFSRTGYDQTVDWWSLGVILFEMIVGYPPFYAESPHSTCQKIRQWKKHFVIPEEAGLSRQAEDLIRRLVCGKEERLGKNGVGEIKEHSFFRGVDWATIRSRQAPFVPDLKGDTDTRYFDYFPEDEPFHPNSPLKTKQRKDLNFIGYTYKRQQQRPVFSAAVQELERMRKSLPQARPSNSPI